MESALGLETFLTGTEGIDGIIKEEPEDFLVREVPLELPRNENGSYCVFWMKARNWETNALLSLLSRRLRINRSSIHIAGTKDKRAISEQLVTIKTREAVDPGIEGLEMKYLYRTDKKLYLGGLYGNEFFVRVRHCRNVDNVPEICEELIEKRGFPNFFGVQRFGIARPNTHRIGKMIVEGDYKGAVLSYICEPGEYDSEEVRKAKDLAMEGRFGDALDLFPQSLEFERLMLVSLAKKEDYVNAIRALPLNLRTMLVYAYQSYLFNRVLSERIRRGLANSLLPGDIIVPIDEHLNPEEEEIPVREYNIAKVERNLRKGRCAPTGAIPGYDSAFAEGEEGEIENNVLREAGFERKEDLKRFLVYHLPELSARGLRRPLQVNSSIRYEIEDDSTVSFSFYLPKGTYATSLLREFMKSDNLRAYG